MAFQQSFAVKLLGMSSKEQTTKFTVINILCLSLLNKSQKRNMRF